MIWLPKFDVKAAIEHLPRATILMGVPTFYTRLLTEPTFTQEVCQSVRVFISGSAPLLTETFTAFQERTGHTILERYGMSETGILTSNPYLETDGPRCGGTVGRPLPGVLVRIQGEPGMIEVKGPGVFVGYWGMPEKTKEEFTDDGYFRTGDLGHFGGEGIPGDYVSIVGRGKDLIISGGFNVYPKEIESVLDTLDGVEESAVVGVPHPDFGEVGVAVLVAKPGATLDPAPIFAALKTQLANFKVPKRIVVINELPRNAMGKVQKNLLREQYKDALR
jgi:malonyl-CoA/methylmalonyl-CoA synthetase